MGLIASVIPEVINKEHQSKNTDRGKEKYTQRHFVHHKFHMNWPGIASRSPRWDADD